MKVALPPFTTLRERLATPRPPISWRIRGWQRAGARVMVTAQHKTGKTILTGNIARTLLDGGGFLEQDQYEVAPIAGTLVLLDFEMSDHQADEWLGAQGIQNDDRFVVISMRGRATTFNILDPVVRQAWAATLRERACEYFVLDCLRPVLDALGLDEHREAGRFLTALDALLTDADISEALVVHHMGHTAERARGDSRLRDWPDAEWRLVRQTEDPASSRFISAFGRDVDIAEAQLQYDPSTRRLSLVGGSRGNAKVGEALTAAIEVLQAASGPMSLRAIQKALEDSEHPRDTVRKAVDHGVASGRLERRRGLRGAHLHSVCERAAACGDRAAHSERECPAAYIKPHARTVDLAQVTNPPSPHTGFDPKGWVS